MWSLWSYIQAQTEPGICLWGHYRGPPFICSPSLFSFLLLFPSFPLPPTNLATALGECCSSLGPRTEPQLQTHFSLSKHISWQQIVFSRLCAMWMTEYFSPTPWPWAYFMNGPNAAAWTTSLTFIRHWGMFLFIPRVVKTAHSFWPVNLEKKTG